MARPSKKTPAKLAALQAARAAGKGLREAAKVARVSHETARNWEQAAVAKAKGRRAIAPASNVDRPCEVIIAVSAQAPHDGAHEPAGDLGVREPMPRGLGDLRQRLASFCALLERLAPAVERDEYSAQNYVTLSRHVDELNAKIAELEPGPTTAPEEKEDDREAARIVLARLESMVSEAETRNREIE